MSKIQSDNSHLANLTSGRFVHIDGSVTTPVTILGGARRLSRVVLNTNGATLRLKNGAFEVVGVIASDAPENTFWYGVWCGNGIVYEASGALSATLVFDE